MIALIVNLFNKRELKREKLRFKELTQEMLPRKCKDTKILREHILSSRIYK